MFKNYFKKPLKIVRDWLFVEMIWLTENLMAQCVFFFWGGGKGCLD